ncbi:MAG TPA: CDP-diacylglycerol--serine O-phosphatidyltransferase [Gemmataceae bacterium]|nr:CDP-diacylglycerol--serine O-phosphatidyltransferase [Gemmataceae bacterium]
MKKIAIIPTLFTLGNAVCGFAAIALASKIDQTPETTIYFAYSAWLILAAMLFDLCDGYVARLSKSASDFGGQLDSLCDAISFGAAPAFLLLRLGRDWEAPVVRQAVAVIAALYMVCTVLRLARFNLENSPDPASHKRFKGLPSPAAAGCLVSLALLRSGTATDWAGFDPGLIHAWVKVWAPVGALLVALLMVSRLPYPHLTKQLLRGRQHFSYLVRLILAGALIILMRELALLVLFWGYALSMPSRYLLTRGLHSNRLPAPGHEVLPR